MRYLTQHFSLAEFTASQTATRLGIDNSLPEDIFGAARKTALLLEQIRQYLSHLTGREIPIQITSGYRCIELNRARKSDDTSHHVIACAADIIAPSFGSATDVALALVSQVNRLGIGQLINEYPDRNGWVHVSTKMSSKPTNQVITLTASGTNPGINRA